MIVDESADESYRVVSIDAVRAPEGCTGGDWLVYRIAQGTNDITGYRRGSLKSVSAEVASIVTALNARRNWGKKAESTSRHRQQIVLGPKSVE